MKGGRTLAQRIGHWLIGDKPARRGVPTLHRRQYAAALHSRTTSGFGSGSGASADAELQTGLTLMRNRSRQMVRDSSYAKRAKAIVVNNVIGPGVGMQAQVSTTRGDLNERINSAIEAAFSEWSAADSCHTGGKLHFNDQERQAFGQIFEAGEVLVRMHMRRFGNSKVPLALELIEAERLAHDVMPGSVDPNADIRMGVEVDRFGRPIAYWIRELHPGDLRMRQGVSDRYERVPADQIFHLYIVDRWPQTRGEPWMHTGLRKVDEMNEYTGLELSAARGSAAYFATITTPDPENASLPTDDTEDDKPVMDLEPLTIQELAPGEELQFHHPDRPNSALDPFMRAMLREFAAGTGVSYESVSRDYSQSNYSSSRLALLEDRDLWRVLQQWWLRSFRLPLHRKWLQQAALAGAIPGLSVTAYATDIAKHEAVRFKPRGWGWVDPTKEVNAFKEAIKGGVTTLTDVIAATGEGRDLEDFIAVRKRELELLSAAGIEVDTTVPKPEPPAAAAPVATATKPKAPPGDNEEDPPPDGGEGNAPDAGRGRVVHIARTA